MGQTASILGGGRGEADDPHSLVVRFPESEPLTTDAGVDISPLTIAYQTYGALNADKSNAVLICHALTGDQHVANTHPVTEKPGWWSTMVGPGKPIDTDRYFVICSNVVGGCMGTTGPASTDPRTGMPHGLSLPVITIRDMVRAQAKLIDHLGIDQLFCVAGGSMGGIVSPARILRHANRRRRASFIAEHRVSRGRPAGHHGRSRLAGRTLLRARPQANQGAGRGAHGRAYHLYVGRGVASEIRS
jgi:homoserine O-acetyltransferase